MKETVGGSPHDVAQFKKADFRERSVTISEERVIAGRVSVCQVNVNQTQAL